MAQTQTQTSAPRGFVDKVIECTDCHRNFTWSAKDQKFYADNKYTNPPKRCYECRQNRKREQQTHRR